MSDRRSGRHVRALTALGVAALLAPLAPVTAHAEEERIDLSSGDLIGLSGDGSALRVEESEAARGEGASLKRDGTDAPHGIAVFPGHPLDEATDSLDVRLGTDGDLADLRTEARGVRADGMWTEWRTVPEGGGRVSLPRDVDEVQVRVEVEGTDSALTDLGVSPLPSTGSDGGSDGGEREEFDDPSGPDPFSARLFATRIGLEGETTANGHVIAADDHFAALPSRRGLANRGGGEYTVRVCSTGEFGPDAEGDTETHDPRCVYVPVWDVGPWNITDDHWNEDRESWEGLDRGRPQAQAAYTEGHNDGLDGFGRQVANPAGIDLADGAFHQGLQMPTNGWVEVDYLWTDDHAHRAEIITESNSEPVVVREGPGAEHDSVGLAAPKAVVDVHCSVTGDDASGPHGTGDTWFRIGDGHYVPGAFADGAGDAPECPDERR
ncbi:hypothetical protein IDM40_16180 [Nocardiopsis sp. HNM0947]|uniref:Secreted protein n=1 Tax=Nocardiopsis coralli TaxID=2772213 RepID=A0ABR9P8T7_9ACTN|nr:hypothetical protein [Nocardiopsis coralli]MBE3000227.1 hypothetical protein [Nocardiopsis coralli]